MKKKIPTSMVAAAVLLCLILFSAHYTTGMYARYITRAAGDDLARAAAFRVSAAPTSSDAVVIKDNGEGSYGVTIRNDGEVAVRYVAVVTSKDRDANELFQTIVLRGELEPQKDKTLVLPFDFSGYTGTATEIPFDVTVTFTQID